MKTRVKKVVKTDQPLSHGTEVVSNARTPIKLEPEPIVRKPTPEPQVIIQRGEKGDRGPKGDEGPPGRPGDTRVNMGQRTVVDSIDYVQVLNVMYHGDLREVNIAVMGICDFRLVDLLVGTVVAEHTAENEELTIETMRDFDLPEAETVLQLQARSEGASVIEVVEFVM